ncbi:methylenetetrahydrofolate reductase [Pseudonocardia humida]|uniref:Methylenetetrahydrofolate reductase n=1 Tax=Pseudonocardia humida TaxID=2800819 RepID=A0ABT0ZZC9_9PSEU|nr:methylenetetrahydrofolate reductase [Pseudonocardia humida]MCO1656109.1 methylenetetrahydrofolate reductase [Pseudonocardia humida]
MSSDILDAATPSGSDGPSDREGRATARAQRTVLARALRNASYEILPFKNTEESVLAHVPKDVALTVTTTEARGLDRTLELTERLSGHGYATAPHLAARLVRDEAHLVDIVARMREAGVDSVFVIGGDAPEAAGEFPDALSLLQRLDAVGHPFRTVGIGGYPEGHGTISDELIEKALRDKAPHATQLVTQLCFDAGTILRWARRVRADGVATPIRVGIPGVVSRQKLVRIAAGLGLGPSARFLAKQQNMLWRFFLPGGYNPKRLVEALAPQLGGADHGIEGFHVFTFNELEKTEAWRRDRIARLSS